MLTKIINFLTFGPKGSSLAARIYLNYTLVQSGDLSVYALIINLMGTRYNKAAAIRWREAHREGKSVIPRKYIEFLNQR